MTMPIAMPKQDHEQEAEGRRPVGIGVDADRGRRAIGAESVERAVRDVQDLHHAEDQRQADGDDEQIGRVDEAVGQDGEGSQHGRDRLDYEYGTARARPQSTCPAAISFSASALAISCTWRPSCLR